MLFSLPTLLILILSAFLSSALSGMLGMGGGVLLLGVIASLVETTYVVPLLAVIQAISNSARLLLFFKNINWRIVGYYVIGLLPGAILGIYIFKLLPKDLIKLMMGVFILLAVFVPTSKSENRLSEGVFIAVGFIAGFIGIFFGVSGPFTGPFYIRRKIIKEELISTKATCQALDQLLKVFLFGFIGINILSNWNIIILLTLAVIVGTIIGKRLLNKLSDKAFLTIFKIVLIVIAVRIVILQILNLSG